MLFQVREKTLIVIASGSGCQGISIWLLINSSCEVIYVWFSKFLSNFMKKSKTEFPLSTILKYSRLLICHNIDCSWYMCYWNPQLVFSTKIPNSSDNIIAGLRFYGPHVIDITYSCDTITHNTDMKEIFVFTICIYF